MHRIGCLVALAFFLAIAMVSAGEPPATPDARDRFKLASTQPECLFTHNDAAMAAAADVTALEKTVSKETLYYIRYLAIQNQPRALRKDYYDASSFTINSLSRSDKIVRPIPTGVDNILIRINLLDYCIDPQAWDSLGRKEIYFHNLMDRVEVVNKTVMVNTTETYLANDGKTYYKQVPKVVVDQIRTPTLQSAVWVDPVASIYLSKTLQTDFPILRADWFITNATLDPTYSKFLGIKIFNDYLDLAAFDPRAARLDVRATIVRSGVDGHCPKVAVNNRVLAREPTFQGYIWRTLDFKTSVNEQNVIDNFVLYVNGGKGKKDAAEYISSLPNKLQLYAITDGKDTMLDKGDPAIVYDSMAINDVFVRNARSCIWCHGSGINKFVSHLQKQVGYRPDQSDLGFFDPDPKKAVILRQKVLNAFGIGGTSIVDFPKFFNDDNRLYADAVKLCNDRTAEDNAALFKNIVDRYLNTDLDRATVSRELGLTEPQLDQVLGLKIDGNTDGVLVQSLLRPPVAIRRDQWESKFINAARLSLLVKPIRPPPQEISGRK